MADQVTRSKKGNKRATRARKRRQCARYRSEGRREINKRRRLERHIRGHRNDLCAKAALGRC